MENLKGKRFGNLTVIDYAPDKRKWKCKCSCGNITYVAIRNLKTGNTKSCGCRQGLKGVKKERSAKKMFSNKIIGQLQVKKVDEKNNKALCYCLQCGNTVQIPIDKLREMNRTKRKSYTCGENGCTYTRKTKFKNTSDSIKEGDVFNNLTVIKRLKNKVLKTKKSFSSIPMFLCKCSCGNVVEVQGRYLLSGKTKSCGCEKEKNFSSKNKYKDILQEKNGKMLYSIYRKWRRKFQNPTNLFKKKVINQGIKFFPELENEEDGFRYFYIWAISNGFSEENCNLERKLYSKDFNGENCIWTRDKTKGY